MHPSSPVPWPLAARRFRKGRTAIPPRATPANDPLPIGTRKIKR